METAVIGMHKHCVGAVIQYCNGLVHLSDFQHADALLNAFFVSYIHLSFFYSYALHLKN